jgi:hypothetical protein
MSVLRLLPSGANDSRLLPSNETVAFDVPVVGRSAVCALALKKLFGILRLQSRRARAFVLPETFRIIGLPSRAKFAVGLIAWLAVFGPTRVFAATCPTAPVPFCGDVSIGVVVGVSAQALGFAPLKLAPPSFREHVNGVVPVRSGEQVVRSHAGRIVAVVQDSKPLRNETDVQFPRDTVREHGVTRLAGADCSVALGVAPRRPYPTARAENWVDGAVLVNLLPKSLGKWTTSHARNLTQSSKRVNHVFIEET